MLRRLVLVLLPCAFLACEKPLTLPTAPQPQQVAVSAVNPLSGYAGDEVQVDGAGFGTDPAALEVLFNGYGARPERVNENGTKLWVRVPVGIRNGQLTVVAPGGRATSTPDFTYLGGGHLEHGAVTRTVRVHSGLGALVRLGDDVFALAAQQHQLVRVSGEVTRTRLELDDIPLAMASAPDAWGRIVVATQDELVLLPSQARPDAKRAEMDLASAPVRVLVPPTGDAALVLHPHLAQVRAIDANGVAARPTALIPVEDGRLVDGVLVPGGSCVVAAVDATPTTPASGFVVVGSRDGLSPRIPTSEELTGPMLVVKAGSRVLVAIGAKHGRLAIFDLAQQTFVSTIDLLTDATVGGLANDDGTFYVSLVEAGRVLAIDLATQQPAWALDVGGEPGPLLLDGGRLYVSNEELNAVQLVDVASRTVVGERRIGIGLGSAMRGEAGLTIRLHATASGDPQPLLYLLGRAGEGLLVIDPAVGVLRQAVLLDAKPAAFALDPDGKRAVVLHDGGRLGLVTFSAKAIQRSEVSLCGVSLACHPFSEPLLSLALPTSTQLVVATPHRIELHELPSGMLLAQYEAEAGGAFASVTATANGVAAIWTSAAGPVDELRFLRFSSLDALSSAPEVTVEKPVVAHGKLLPLGSAAVRAKGDAASPVYFFLRSLDGTAIPWFFAPERTAALRAPAPSIGLAPQFSPDGRQVVSLAPSPDGSGAMLLFARGELLSSEPLASQSALELEDTPQGFAFAPGGTQAVAAVGDDTLLVLE